MLGISGLDLVGLFHAICGLVALGLGLAVIVSPKGTLSHRMIGGAYVAVMTLLNLTALWIFDLTGHFGPFHLAALISLTTLLLGYFVIKRGRQLVEVHAYFMSWSYVGLIAALAAEIAVRVPGVGFSRGLVAATAITVLGGALLIHVRVPILTRRLRAAHTPVNGGG